LQIAGETAELQPSSQVSSLDARPSGPHVASVEASAQNVSPGVHTLQRFSPALQPGVPQS
jgi:hypothetical protein